MTNKLFLRSLLIGLFALSAAGCTGGASISAPHGPVGPAITHLYVSDGASGHIYIYSLPLGPGATSTGTISALADAYDMKVDSAGRLFVGSGSPSVHVFAPPITSGSPVAFSLPTSPSHGPPVYLAFDALSNLFVSEIHPNCCIDEFNAPVGAASPVNFTMMNHGGVNDLNVPFGVAFDSSGRLYVSSGSSILMYAPTLGSGTIPTATVTPNQNNYGLAVGPTNQLYVENATTNGVIDVFATPLTSGVGTRLFGIPVAAATASLKDITIDPTGNLYVTSNDGHVYFIPAPITAASVPTAALTFMTPTQPYGITVGP